MTSAIMVVTAILLFSRQVCSKPASASRIEVLRPCDADEDDVEIMIDSAIVGVLEPACRAGINVSSGDHWLIFRYGPKGFPHHDPQYWGGENSICATGDKLHFREHPVMGRSVF